MTVEVDMKALLESGAHFGHKTSRRHPKMAPYIHSKRQGGHIINLEKTVEALEKALPELTKIATSGKKILFVGCKRQAQEAVREAAEATGQYYVNHRWLGGMLTNMSTIRKSIERLAYLEGIEKSPEFKSMSKKELAALDRERQKLERNLQGIRNMGGAPDAMVAIGADHEDIAIREAHRLNIPVCVLVDTNADPKEIDFPIPGNDDAVRSIRLILDCIVKAINEGKGASAEA